MLAASGLTKSFGDVHALAGADLQVSAGQVVALLGRNGAGKTTLLSIVAGLLRPDAGAVDIDGVDALADPEAAAKLVGIAPQDTGVYPVLSVRHNLEFFGELSGMDTTTRERSAAEVADKLGLTPLLDRRAGKLSGGETRRLHTACALVHTPRLLMLDEPTVGADVTTRLQIIDAVKALAADGAAVIYTTHYLPEVEALDADIVIIDDGRVLASGSQPELVERHQIRGLRFEVEGPLPTTPWFTDRADDFVELSNGVYRLLGDLEMSDLLGAFGGEASRLISVETLKPDLETVFLAVTGNRIDDEVDSPDEGPKSTSSDPNGSDSSGSDSKDPT